MPPRPPNSAHPSPGSCAAGVEAPSLGQPLPNYPGKRRRVVATDCGPAALPAGSPSFFALLACVELGPVACLIVWMTL